jgi:hypothetical protein
VEDIIPDVWINILQWFPSIAIMRLIRTAMAETISSGYFIPQILVLIVSTCVILAFDTWLLRRMDR